MIVAETARLRLREFTSDDALFVLALVNEPAWIRFIGDRNVHSVEDARGYLARGPAASYATHGYGLWAVELLATGEPIGMCGLIRREALEHVDLGFAFLSSQWGQGYARESAVAVVELAQERYHLPSLVAITDTANHPSKRVLEGVGFRFEKLIRWTETAEDLALYSHPLASGAASARKAPKEIVMPTVWKPALQHQFGAAIDMLENAIRACPDALWADDTQQPRFWYVAYHTLFWLDLYLSDSLERFVPPAPYTLDELDPAGRYPERAYTKPELLAYLAHGRAKCRATLVALDDTRATERCSFEFREQTVLELHFYNMRHVQHHAGQLNLVLRQRTDSAPRWVARGGKGTDAGV